MRATNHTVTSGCVVSSANKCVPQLNPAFTNRPSSSFKNQSLCSRNNLEDLEAINGASHKPARLPVDFILSASAFIPDGNFLFTSQSPIFFCQPSSTCSTSKGKSPNSSNVLKRIFSSIFVYKLYHEHHTRGT